jgi:ATP-binding cassette subfamily F protein uup
VLVRGRPRHIVSYLKDFLFSEEQVYGLISDLSGGEKSRLLLAILMARESNLIVLDEPTNDLDLETLDLLKELISLYDGTIVFVSHDRDFIDSIASHTFLMQKDKPIIVHAGGFSDFRNSLGDIEGANSVSRIKMRKKTIVNLENLNEKNKQSLEKRINEVNIKIERLNYEIGKLESGLSEDNLYIENQKKFDLITDELLSRKKILEEAEEEWLKIELQRSV